MSNFRDIQAKLFVFGSDGYTFNDKGMNYALRPTYAATSDLQAVVNVMQLYQEDTYTYTKKCQTIVVGYGENGIQTIQLPCEYGGVRDIGALIHGNPHHLDLAAIVLGEKPQKDLNAWFRFAESGSKDFYTWYRLSQREHRDLSGYMKFVQGSKIPFDLGAIIQEAVQPTDIQALLNVIELRDLGADITASWWKGSKDLSATFFKTYYRQYKDVAASIRGWDTSDLTARITSYWTKDLQATLNAGFFAIHKDLVAILSTIQPYDLGASLHGYDYLGLKANIIENYQPGDLQAYITSVQPFDLKARIYGMKALAEKYDLKVLIQGVRSRDLIAYINTIQTLDLSAHIDAIGKYLDLEARIAPRTINIKRMLQVPLFEHLDLRAVINFNCLKSSYSDLTARINTIYRLNLKGYIIGWNGDYADNLIDLKAHINCASYNSQNYIDISGSPIFKQHSHHEVQGDFEKIYKKFNTFSVEGGVPVNLTAFITGVLNSANLAARIKAQPIAAFTTVPSWVNPSTNTVVLNLKNLEERWVRFIEMMFFTNGQEDYHYFYVSGEDKIYKVDKNRTWQIRVEGYTEDEENIYKRTKVRRKFIFNMKNYDSVDSAIRDMIDRVSLFRHHDLSAVINGYDWPSINLRANIYAKYRRSWSSDFKANITCRVKSELALQGIISPQWLQDSYNLTANIIGKSYEPPAGDDIDFNFEYGGYVPPTPYRNMDWTYKQAEKYWK